MAWDRVLLCTWLIRPWSPNRIWRPSDPIFLSRAFRRTARNASGLSLRPLMRMTGSLWGNSPRSSPEVIDPPRNTRRSGRCRISTPASRMPGGRHSRSRRSRAGSTRSAFPKDPLVVNDIFLKKPSRIDALGMVLILALMIWRLMERSMRTHVKNAGTSLPGWAGRPTDKPTSFMMTTVMTGIMVARIGHHRTPLRPPGKGPMAFLEALGLDSNVFIDPAYRCTPIIPRKSA